MNATCLGPLAVALFISIAARTLSAPYVPIQATQEQWDEFYQVLQGSGSFEEGDRRLRSLPQEKKAFYIKLRRNFDPEKPWNDLSQGENWQELLALGDAITGEYLLRQFEQAPSEDLVLILGNWHTPAVLALHAKQTLIDDPMPKYAIDAGWSFRCSETLVDLLQAVPGVPGPVRHWAAGLKQERTTMLRELEAAEDAAGIRTQDPSKKVMLRGREIARAWARANEKALAEGRLQDLQPGEYYQPERHRRDDPEPPARRISLTPAPAAIPTPKVPPTCPPESQEAKPSGNLWPWLAVGLAALLGVLAVFFKRRIPGRKTDSQK